MEKNKNTRFVSIVAIFVALITVSIAFAALSQTLNINGTADVIGSDWSIIFENLQNVGKTGTAEEVTTPTINNEKHTISSYEAKLYAPGDSITYTFDVKNEGSIDAKIDELTVPIPTCTGSGTAAETDAEKVANHLNYTLKYAGGTDVAVDDTLLAGETKTMELKLEYEDFDDASDLPASDVAVTTLEVIIKYLQNTTT